MSLDEAGIEPPLQTWVHRAAPTTETALSLFIGQRRVDFEKRAAFPQAMTIEINPAHLRPVIPGFPDLIPDFETKKPDFQHITAREHNRNITLPFTLRRPVVVAEYSQTTRIAAHTAFVVQTPGVTLTLGIGGFVGCEVRVFNSASGAATVVYGEGASATLKQDGIIRFEWQGGRWKRRMLAAEDTPDGWGAYREGRNLLDVLEVAAIPDAMAILKARCNNGGSAANGEPDFAGLQIGDYLDGLDLSAIPAENGGAAGQAWNDTYKNNRIVIASFNTYMGADNTENTKNHILFTFADCPIKARMNPSNTNSGGYRASKLRAFLEGTNGAGAGDKSGVTTAAFMNALKAQIGDVLYTIRKLHSVKSNNSWASYTVFLPSELEVYGYPAYGDEGVYMPAITSSRGGGARRVTAARFVFGGFK